jgi:hypothetical protein
LFFKGGISEPASEDYSLVAIFVAIRAEVTSPLYALDPVVTLYKSTIHVPTEGTTKSAITTGIGPAAMEVFAAAVSPLSVFACLVARAGSTACLGGYSLH